MRGSFLVAISLLLVGCHHRKPAVSDADFEAFRAYNPGATQWCLDDYRYGGPGALPLRTSDCYEMLPDQHWSGLWNSGWEWSIFCPAPAQSCPQSASNGGIALEFSERAPPEVPISNGMLFRVQFIGRRTKEPGHYDHLGQYKHVVVVDRMISIKRVDSPPQRGGMNG